MHFLALFASFLLSLLILHQGLPHISTHVFGGGSGDGGLYVYLLQTACSTLFKTPMFSLPSFYPFDGSLAWSDNYLLPSCVAQPFLYFASPTLVHNLMMIVATTLSGYSTFTLARYIGLKTVGAFIALIAFEGFPFFASHLGHAQLQWNFVLPLGLYYFFRSIDSSAKHTAGLFGLTLVAALLTSVYYFIFLGIICAILSLYLLHQKALKQRLLWCWAGAVLPLLVVSPVLTAYIKTKDVFGARLSHEIFSFAVDIFSYISPTPNSQWHAFFSFYQDPEKTLFVSFTALFLALIGLIFRTPFSIIPIIVALACGFINTPTICATLSWLAVVILFFISLRKRHKETEYDKAHLLCVALVFSIIFSFGFRGTFGVFDLFYKLVPGFDGVRAVGRWGVPAALAISLLAGFGASRFPRAVLVLIPFLLWEVTPRSIGLEPIPPAPAVFKEIKKDSVVLVLPITQRLTEGGKIESWSDFARRNTDAMNWGAQAHVTTINGYSGVRTRFLESLPWKLRNFPDKASYRELFVLRGLDKIVLTKDFDLSKLSNEQRSEINKLTVARGNDGSLLLSPPGYYKLEDGSIEFVGKIGEELKLFVRSLEEGTVMVFGQIRQTVSAGKEVEIKHFFWGRRGVPEKARLTVSSPVVIRE